MAETLSRSSSIATVMPGRSTRPGSSAALGLLQLPIEEQEPLVSRAEGAPFARRQPASSTLKLSNFTQVMSPPVSPSQPVRKHTEQQKDDGSQRRRAGSVTSDFSGLEAETEGGMSGRARSGTVISAASSVGVAHLSRSRTSSEISPLFGSALSARKSEEGAVSASMSRTGSNTSSGGASTSSSSDYLATPAQHPSFFEPRIVKAGDRSPWSQSSREGASTRLSAERRRDHQPSPAMVDPRFHFPMKRGSLTKPVTGNMGLGLRLSSEQPTTAKSEGAGSYIASLGMAPLVDEQGHPLPASSPHLSNTSSPSSSPEMARSLSLPPASSSAPTRLLSAFQPTSSATAPPRRKISTRRRSSPKSKTRQQHRAGSPGSRRPHRRAGSSASGSSTDRAVASSSAMRVCPSAPDLHVPSTPPRARIQHSYRPSQQAHAGILRTPRSIAPIPARAPTPASTYEAYFLPRPRLALASPQAPSASQLQAEWRRRRAIAKGRAPESREEELEQLADEEDELSVRRVLRENEESRRERAAWSDSNAHSLGFGLSRKLSLGGSMRRRSKSVSRCQAPATNEWEADSDVQAAAVRRRKSEKQRVRLEREQRARWQAAAGSDTEQEGAAQTGDEGGYLNPYYSPPTARSFDPFAQAAAEAASPIKGLVRKLSGRRRRSSKSRERRKASDAGLSSDGGAPKSSWSGRGRRSSEAPPPLPGLTHSASLADFNASGPLRFVGNRPIRHLRTSPSVDSLSPRHAQAPITSRTEYGEALSDLNGAPLHGRKMSITEPAPVLVKQNAALSLPPHLHHLLRSPTAPTTRTLEEQQDVSFLPTRAPPSVPRSDESPRTSTSKESGSRMSNDSAARLYVALDRKLSEEEAAATQQPTTVQDSKENARPVVAAPSIAALAIHSTTATPLTWRARRRSSSVDSLSASAPSPNFSPPRVTPLPPPNSLKARPPSTQPDHSTSLPPPPRRPARLGRLSLDPSPSLSVGSGGSATSALPQDLTTSFGSPPSALDPTATPTLGSKRTAGVDGKTYFDLPTAGKEVRGLAMTSDDPFAPRASIDSDRSEEDHSYALRREQAPMDSPESARSSGNDSVGQTSVLEIDDGEARFDNLFFRPPPSEADRSILPTPTPIDMHRLSGSSRLTSSTFDLTTINLPPASSNFHGPAPTTSQPGDDASIAGSLEAIFVDDGESSHRRSWHSSDGFEEGDETFGIGGRRQLRLSLQEGLPFDEEEEDDRSSTRQSEAWATAEDGGESEEEEGEEEAVVLSSFDTQRYQEPPTPISRPGPTPSQGDWSTTSFAREYLGSFTSQPPSAPAEQSSFLDFTLPRDSRHVAISPTPTQQSRASSGSGRGSFLEFDDEEALSQPKRESESRNSFLEEWSPPSSPKRFSALSLPVILSTPVLVAEGGARSSPTPSLRNHSHRDSHLSTESRLGPRSEENSPAASPMGASFHSGRLSRLDDFPNPPIATDGTSHQLQSTVRRLRSMPQVFPERDERRGYKPSPLAAEGGSGRRSSASFLDLQEDHRPLSLATTTSSIYSSQPSTLRPTSGSSFVSFFSEGRSQSSMLDRGFVFRLEESEDR